MPDHGQDKLLPYVVLALVVIGGIIVWVIVKRQSEPMFPRNWQNDLVAATAQGKAEGRPVLVLFHTGPLGNECQTKMIRDVLTVEGSEEKFWTYRHVLVHTATSKRSPLATEWKLQKLPTMVILDSAGNEVRRNEGYIEAATFWNKFIVPTEAPLADRAAGAQLFPRR